MPFRSKSTLFAIYSEDKILTYTKGNGRVESKNGNHFDFCIYTVQNLWTKTSIFNSNAQKSYIRLVPPLHKKTQLKVVAKSKISSVYFVEHLQRKNFYRADFPYLQTSACVFFLALKVTVSSTQFFLDP